MRKKIAMVACLTTSILSVSCVSPVKIETPTQYFFPYNFNIATIKFPQNKSIMIAPMSASTPIDSLKMAYATSKTISYFAKNEWIASPADMLTNLISFYFRANYLYKSVVNAPFTGNTDLRLSSQLLSFQQEFNSTGSYFHLIVVVQLINSNSNTIVASKQWDIVEKCQRNNPEGGYQAARKAINRFLNELIKFCGEK